MYPLKRNDDIKTLFRVFFICPVPLFYRHITIENKIEQIDDGMFIPIFIQAIYDGGISFPAWYPYNPFLRIWLSYVMDFRIGVPDIGYFLTSIRY